MPSPDDATAVQITESASVPLTDPVWVRQEGGTRQVLPGTEEYYDLRVRDRCHVEAGRLVSSLCMQVEVLQVLSGPLLWVRKVYPARYGGEGSGWTGYARGEPFAVQTQDTNGIAAGAVMKFQLRDTYERVAAQTTDGKLISAPRYETVSSPSFDWYAQWSTGVVSTAQPAQVFSISDVETGMPGPSMGMSDPVPTGAENRQGKEPLRQEPEYFPKDPAMQASRLRELARDRDTLRDDIKRRNTAIASFEKSRDGTSDPEERAALEEVIRRARMHLAEAESSLDTVSNTQMRVESRIESRK